MRNEPCIAIERSIIKEYRKEIWRPFIKGLQAYEMIKEGDHIAVCISGGKDSMLLAKCMQELKRHSPMSFELEFIVMDPGYCPANREQIESNARLMEIPIQVFESDIFNSVADVEQSPCYLCARMRRGYLYDRARHLGCNKIALGHHYDDVIETILMGVLYGGQFNTMMPKLHSTNFPGMELIIDIRIEGRRLFLGGRITTAFIFSNAPAVLRSRPQRSWPPGAWRRMRGILSTLPSARR